MNTCENCEWWNAGGHDADRIPVGFCRNMDAFPTQASEFRPRTFGTFSCNHHKPKEDWANKAAIRIQSTEMPNACTVGNWCNIAAKIIREEAQKAGLK